MCDAVSSSGGGVPTIAPAPVRRRFKARVYRDTREGRPAVVKTFRDGGPLRRLVGRLLTAREARAYEALAGLPGVPRLLDRPDPHTLVLEWVDGEELGYAPDRERRGLRVYPRLVAAVEAIHARGVAHGDLRSRHNVLVTAADTVFVVDFAGAVRADRGGIVGRWLFRRLAAVDRSALLKWKEVLRAGPYSEAEEAALHRFRRWRGVWFLNRKPDKTRWDDRT